MIACRADAMLAFVLTLLPVAALSAAGPAPRPCASVATHNAAAPPWEGVEAIPADVDLYLHVDGAAELRRSMRNLPLAQAFAAAFVDDELAERWSCIAKRLGRGEEQCFDELLGRELRLVMRRGPDGADWLLATELDDATLARVRDGLGGRMSSGGIIEFPCQGLVAAWRAPMLVVAPSRDAALFRAAIDGQRPATALGADPLVTSARTWGATQLQFFLRHSAPLEGSSVVTAEFNGRTATIRHRTRLPGAQACEEPDEAETAPIDRAVLDRFESMAVIGMVRRQCDASVLSMIQSVVPGTSPCSGMRENAGDRWLMLVGDAEVGGDCRVPAVAVALEVREPCKGRRQHEAFLHRAVERYNERYAARFGAALEPPMVAACTDLEAPRHCDIGPPLRAASGNHPLLRTCSLYWRTVAGERMSWQVYATHRDWLDRVSQRLEENGSSGGATTVAVAADGVQGDAAIAAAARRARATGAVPTDGTGTPRRDARGAEGFLRGAAVADMLESWGRHAEEFAAAEPARFRRGVTLLASLLRGVEQLQWGGSSREGDTVESTIWVDLAPPSAP